MQRFDRSPPTIHAAFAAVLVGVSAISPAANAGNVPPNQPTLVQPAAGTQIGGRTANLTVNVSDPDGAPINVRYFGRKLPTGGGEPFSLVALPDTQFYSESFPATFTAQTQWVLDNIAAFNIKYVAHLGDIVNQSGQIFQWENADTSISVLDNAPTLPYGLSVGNHDQEPCCGGAPSGTTNFNWYFPISRYQPRPWYGGHFGLDNDNSFLLFSASGLDFVVVHLEFDTAANPSVLAWAESIFRAYPERRGILVSHYLIGTGNPGAWGPQGQATYNALRDVPNLSLMLFGHIAGEGLRVDTFAGNTIHTVLADYQARTLGGTGWLRIMEFRPADNAIRVRTYSPTLGIFEVDANSQFTISYDMGGESIVELGQRSGIPSGGNANLSWSSLEPNSTYQWYVVINDGSFVVQSPTWTFTTGDALRGDMNCDSVITVGDIGGFVLALTNPTAYQAQYPGCDLTLADMNDDMIVSVGDIGAFVNILVGGV